MQDQSEPRAFLSMPLFQALRSAKQRLVPRSFVSQISSTIVEEENVGICWFDASLPVYGNPASTPTEAVMPDPAQL